MRPTLTIAKCREFGEDLVAMKPVVLRDRWQSLVHGGGAFADPDHESGGGLTSMA